MFRMFIASLVICAGSAAVVRADDPAPLSGPKVTDTGIPGESKSFGATGAKLKGEVRSIDDKILLQAIGSLRGEKVEQSLRLTADQEAAIREATQKAIAARREFYKAHEEEIRSIMTDLGVDTKDLRGERDIRAAFEKAKAARDGSKKVRKDAQGTNPEGQMTDEAAQKRDVARQKLMEIRAQMPKPDDAHSSIWAALTPAQKEVVQARIKDLSNEQTMKRQLPGETKKVQRKLQDKKDEAAKGLVRPKKKDK